MFYLLDADTLITGNRRAYPLRRFPIFWQWLRHQGDSGRVKIPIEQYEEIIAGRGDLVDWLNFEENRDALLFQEEADFGLVTRVTNDGYAPDLNENEIEEVGRDPFLISYGLVELGQRTIVSFEVSSPAKRRSRRKIPDVCRDFGIPCCDLYGLIDALDFTTDWRP